MALSEILETILELKGVGKFKSLLKEAAGSLNDLSGAVGTPGATGAKGGATGALTGLGLGMEAAGAAALNVLPAAVALAFLAKSVHEFGEGEQTLFRTAVVLRNLGSSLKADELNDFVGGLQKVAAFNPDELVKTAGLLASFGVPGDKIKSLLPSILDASKATGDSVEAVGEAVARGLVGNTRGLHQLGIAFTATHDRAKDLLTIQTELDKRFSGAAAAQRNTAFGAFEALRESTANFFQAIGRLAGPVLVNTLLKISDFIQGLADKVDKIADRLGISHGNLAEGVGGKAVKGDPEQTALLGKIEANTKSLNDKLVQRVLGGPGSVASRALGLRDTTLAFGV